MARTFGPALGRPRPQGTNSKSEPTDATLQAYEFAAGSGAVIDGTLGSRWIFSVGD